MCCIGLASLAWRSHILHFRCCPDTNFAGSTSPSCTLHRACAALTRQRLVHTSYHLLTHRPLFTMMNILAMTLLGLATLTLANTHSTFHVRDFDLYKLADDATWDKYKCKGSQLVQAMKGTDAEAGQLFGRTSAESEFKGEMKRQ